jgi:hypothetical protein
MRYGLTFENDRQYLVNSLTTGSEGFDAARPRELPGAWADLPAEVAASCSPVKYYFLMTSAAAPAADLFSIDLAIDVKSDLACDECLIGVWDLNVASFEEYAEAPFAETPGYYQFIAAGGPFRYGFRADATLIGEFDFTYVYRLNQENSPLGNDVGIDGSIKLEGEGLGHYTSDGIGGMTMMLADSGVKLTQTLAINGEEMDPTLFGGSGPNFGAGSLAVRYSCDGDKLYLNFLPEASALPPILFDRDPSADP